jgi:uncharacterized Zn-finger protein
VDDAELRQAMSQADELQDRLVRAAYGLHFSCANVVSMLEHLALTSEPAQRIGFEAESRRWRQASEHALNVVRVWEHHRLPQQPTVACAGCDAPVVVGRWFGDPAVHVDITNGRTTRSVSCPNCGTAIRLTTAVNERVSPPRQR